MNTDELARQLIALPLADPVDLAQALWESIDSTSSESVPEIDEGLLTRAERRDSELTTGHVAGRSHAEVMAAARRALGCD